jgi:serine/threonine-protein kinase
MSCVDGEGAEAVVHKLEPRLLDADKRRGTRRPAENLAARNLYLQGRYHLNQRTDEGLQKALDFFEKAIVEDAQFAPAHSSLADAHSLLAHCGVRARRGVDDGGERRGVRHAGRQLRRSDLIGARQGDQDWTGTAPNVSLVPSARPALRDRHHWYATSCLRGASTRRSTGCASRSRSTRCRRSWRDIAMIHAYRRDYEAALEQCDHTIELNPHFSPAYWTLGMIQEQRRDLDEAIAAFQRAIDLSPNSPRMHAALARTLALSGRKADALATLRKVEAIARQRYVSPMEFAVVRFALDQPELGFRALSKACEDRAFDVLALKVDPDSSR